MLSYLNVNKSKRMTERDNQQQSHASRNFGEIDRLKYVLTVLPIRSGRRHTRLGRSLSTTTLSPITSLPRLSSDVLTGPAAMSERV